MEKSLEFNSQICTTIEQSQKLLALGLKKETADMWYLKMIKDYKGNEIPETRKKWWLTFDGVIPGAGFEQYVRLPAWSLHRLMELATAKRKVILIRVGDDLYDTLIEKIRRMIADGVFNPEYLENKL